ncbi:hypothetical protein [Saliterribacillus persicus]|uniref:hypothetical protein n=1 Tax=Saliterribacillus persicus TaxID=930114 RepID=UPI0011C07DD3|nr:hypothetical protein [Saliterribacillus persicus]
MKSGLDYSKRGVDDIKLDLKSNENKREAVGDRVTRVKESAMQAHKCVDVISKKNAEVKI